MIQHRDTVVFYGTMLPEPRQVARLLQAQLDRSQEELQQEAISTAARQEWQQTANLRARLADIIS